MYIQTYRPTIESIKTHKLPQWYNDAKLGIFIHWGLYSVPAFAPPTCELGDIPTDAEWFCNNPYAEWYLNSIRVGRGPTWEHHIKKYGLDFDYSRFSDMWHAEVWNPLEWADLFKKAGAAYVVLTTKHHDGFCLWPSQYTEYNSVQKGPRRDIMGELTRAVRAQGMKMGAYYSGMIDWRYASEPIFDEVSLRQVYPRTWQYADYAYMQSVELIETYEPSLFWNDIGWPEKGESDIPYLLSHYYNRVQDGLVNDRWNNIWHDFTTKEYKQGESSLTHKWEMCRGLGLSFGYNANEDDSHCISREGLISLLVSTVAHNGNLLINVGPMADGRIPAIQQDRLLALGKWLADNGEAIYGTQPWNQQVQHCKNAEVYFTRKKQNLYVIADKLKKGHVEIEVSGIPNHGKTAFLGNIKGSIKHHANGTLVLTMDIPEGCTCISVCLADIQ